MSFVAWLESPPAWGIPLLEALHLCAIAGVGGAVLLLDLRLLGLLFADRPLALMERESRRLLLPSFGLAAITGGLLFLSEVSTAAAHPAFRLKMAALLVALAVQAGARRSVARGKLRPGPLAVATGALSTLLLLMVASAGRWIGFS